MRYFHFFILTFIYSIVFSQEKLIVEFQVTPKFQTDRNADFKVSAKVSNFELVIDGNESYYNHISKINNEQVEENGFNMKASFSAAPNPIYINTHSQTYIRQVKVGNRSYLINDDLPNFDWKITKETSEILGFPVLKAVAFLNDEFNTKILAWYSPKLTYKTGPDKFWGLPGLILSLETSITHSNGNQEEMEYVAVKVGKTNKSTKIPNQGKKVNFAEYKIIQSDFLQKQRKMLGIEKD